MISSKIENSEKHRIFWLDLARFIAIVSITCNHALSRSFFTHDGTRLEYTQMSIIGSFFKAFLYVFSRIGVPIFLMISGALLLKRDYENKETIHHFYVHNWWKLFRTTEIWLTIMFWYLQISNDSLLHSKGIVTALIHFFSTILFANQCTMPSMWYMSMILIVYLMIPVIAIGVKRIGNKLFYILALVAMMSGMIVPNINTALNAMGINKSIDFAFNISDVFSIYFLYILAGYWIGNDMFKQAKTIRVLIGFIICFIGTAVFQMWIYSTDSDYYVRYADIGVLLSASFLFELVKRRLDANDIIKRLITYISKISFGIYFVCLL